MKINDLSLLSDNRFPYLSGSWKKPIWHRRTVVGIVVILSLVTTMTISLAENNKSARVADAAEQAVSQAPTSEATDVVHEGEDSGAGKEGASESNRKPANGNGASVKLIPDQKAFVGSPDTLIQLEDVFQDTLLARHGGPLELEVLRSKEDVAEAVIEGTTLRLKWGTKTGKKREVLVRATYKDGAYVDTKFNVELWEPDY